MSAVMDKYTEIVNLVLERGADIEATNKAGRTPLMLAILIKDQEMFEFLLKKGANIEAKDKEGNTPLMMAGKKEFVEAIEILLIKGANIDARNNRGHTAIHLAKASSVYRTQAVRRLVNTKAHQDLDQDNSSRSSLSSSVRTERRVATI
jgi:ankyrin repeat protein